MNKNKTLKIIFAFTLVLIFCFPALVNAQGTGDTGDPCADDSACLNSHYCSTDDASSISYHTCVPDNANGDPCTSVSQCQSGNCENNVCAAAVGPTTGSGGQTTGSGGQQTGGTDTAAKPGTLSLPNFLGTGDPNVVIGRLVKAVIGISGSIALAIFIYGGALWMFSAGNPERVKKGRAAMTYAAIGLAIIFLSYTIVAFVLEALVQ